MKIYIESKYTDYAVELPIEAYDYDAPIKESNNAFISIYEGDGSNGRTAFTPIISDDPGKFTLNMDIGYQEAKLLKEIFERITNDFEKIAKG